jgi:hypothetical protein
MSSWKSLSPNMNWYFLSHLLFVIFVNYFVDFYFVFQVARDTTLKYITEATLRKLQSMDNSNAPCIQNATQWSLPVPAQKSKSRGTYMDEILKVIFISLSLSFCFSLSPSLPLSLSLFLALILFTSFKIS